MQSPKTGKACHAAKAGGFVQVSYSNILIYASKGIRDIRKIVELYAVALFNTGKSGKSTYQTH